MSSLDIPRNVVTYLDVKEAMGGFSGVFPGYFHEKFSLRYLLFDVVMSLLWMLLSIRRFQVKTPATSGSRDHGRSVDVPFQFTQERCVIGAVNLPWSRVLFIRLTRPSPHLSYVTLQVFEKSGPEHRWRIGADVFSEVSWVVDQKREYRDGVGDSDVPDSLVALMKGASVDANRTVSNKT